MVMHPLHDSLRSRIEPLLLCCMGWLHASALVDVPSTELGRLASYLPGVLELSGQALDTRELSLLFGPTG